MAEYCPKCNYKMRIRDWRPECPKCGVNVIYYKIEDRLRADADEAEYSHAMLQPKIDRLKFSLIGHPLAIVRLIIGILPLVATLLPMGVISYNIPYNSVHETVNIISVINLLTSSSFDIGLLTKLLGAEALGKGFICMTVAVVAFALLLIWSLVGFIMLVLSASPKGYQRNFVFPAVGMILSTVSFVAFVMMLSAFSSNFPNLFSGSINPIAYIAIMICFIALIVINILYKKMNIEVKYTDVSELLLPYAERPSTIEKKGAAGGSETANANA